MLTVDLIDDERRFAAMAEEWDALLRVSAARCVFLTWEWLHTWWRHLSQSRTLAILAVREDGELVGIAPFALRRGWLTLASRLEFLGSGDVGSDYLDLISKPGFEVRVLGAVTDHLARRPSSLRLQRLDPSSALAADLGARLGAAGWGATRSNTEICPFVALDGHTWDSYLATLGAEHRYNVRRRLRHLERAGAVFERVVCEEQLREVLPALVALHNERWRERGGSEAFHSAGLVAFHAEWSRIALARGWLRLYALRLDGQVAAALYGFLYDRRFSFYQSGFDPRARKLSLGLATMAFAIASAIEEGALSYDLLHGDEAYKFLWCHAARELVQLELFPPTVAGGIAQQAGSALRRVRRVARRRLPLRVLEAADTARRFWRGRDLGAAAAR